MTRSNLTEVPEVPCVDYSHEAQSRTEMIAQVQNSPSAPTSRPVNGGLRRAPIQVSDNLNRTMQGLQDPQETRKRLQERKLQTTKEVSQVRLMSTAQAARYLGCAPSTVRKLHHWGHFSAIRVLRQMRYDVKELDAWIERQKEA